jgi:uncharacterized membrane protein YbaN (DUF454 family)
MLRLAIRWLYLTSGWCCLGIGTLGVLLPVLPTTPFVLLAAACFSQSSPRFHRWLLNNSLFGKMIQNWQSEGYVDGASKKRAFCVVTLTFGFSIWMVDPITLKGMLVAFWLLCSLVITQLPTIPRSLRSSVDIK